MIVIITITTRMIMIMMIIIMIMIMMIIKMVMTSINLTSAHLVSFHHPYLLVCSASTIMIIVMILVFVQAALVTLSTAPITGVSINNIITSISVL